MRERRLRQQRSDSTPLFDYDLNVVDIDAHVVINGRPANVAALITRLLPPPFDGDLKQSAETGVGQAPAACEEAGGRKNPEVPQNGDRGSSKPRNPILSRAEPSRPNGGNGKVEIHNNLQDPMEPALYIGHHRRMEREERRMQQLEKQHLLVDYLRVLNQRAQLVASDWRAHIDKIVKISAKDNDYEAAAKRKLAIEEIDEFLRRYNHWKRRRTSSIPAPPDATQIKPPKPSRSSKDAKKVQKKAKTSPSVPHTPVLLELRPFAFGRMAPRRRFPPREFALPRSWVSMSHSDSQANPGEKQKH